MSDTDISTPELVGRIDDIWRRMSLDAAASEAALLEDEMAKEGFWDDSVSAQEKMKRLSTVRARYEPWQQLRNRTRELLEMEQAFESDDQVLASLGEERSVIVREFHSLETQALMSGEHDDQNAILEINAGAGGTEACDWVDMLFRMYARWAERRQFRVEIVDQIAGEAAGSKSITAIISGPAAYGWLRSESGVHRLVRISPFDANKRRHTSFAAVDVIPEISADSLPLISDDDVRIETYRASSAGGQNVQKNETAVRLTHIPTGTVAQCQNERSQRQNKEIAMRVLIARLMELKEREHAERIEELRGERKPIEWGSQIRSYVFAPYTLVKDHRADYDTGDVQRVMNGEIDDFMEANLRAALSEMAQTGA